MRSLVRANRVLLFTALTAALSGPYAIDALAQLDEKIPPCSPQHTESMQLYYDTRRKMEANQIAASIPGYSQFIKDFQTESQSISNEDRASHDYYLSFGYQNRAYCYLTLGQYSRAITDLTDAIRLRPLYPVNYMNRAQAYNRLGQRKLAEADMKTYQKLLIQGRPD